MSSLWKVDDAAANIVYGAVLQKNVRINISGVIVALQGAMRNMIRGRTPRYDGVQWHGGFAASRNITNMNFYSNGKSKT